MFESNIFVLENRLRSVKSGRPPTSNRPDNYKWSIHCNESFVKYSKYAWLIKNIYYSLFIELIFFNVGTYTCLCSDWIFSCWKTGWDLSSQVDRKPAQIRQLSRKQCKLIFVEHKLYICISCFLCFLLSFTKTFEPQLVESW